MMAPPSSTTSLATCSERFAPAVERSTGICFVLRRSGPEHGNLEEARLGQEVRQPLLVVQHVADHEGIDLGAVVRRGDEAAGGKVLESLPLLGHQEVHQRARTMPASEHER